MFADKVVLFCHVTSKVTDDTDQELLKEKGGRGFPYLVFMDAEGEVIAKQGGRTVTALEKSVGALDVLAKLKNTDLTKDKSAAAASFIARLQLGKIEYADAKEEAATLELSEKQKAGVNAEFTNMEAMEIYQTARKERDFASLGSKYKKMFDAGRIPTGNLAGFFWNQLLNYAMKEKDAELFGKALDPFKKLNSKNERAKPMLEWYDAVHAALKSGEELPPRPSRRRRR